MKHDTTDKNRAFQTLIAQFRLYDMLTGQALLLAEGNGTLAENTMAEIINAMNNDSATTGDEVFDWVIKTYKDASFEASCAADTIRQLVSEINTRQNELFLAITSDISQTVSGPAVIQQMRLATIQNKVQAPTFVRPFSSWDLSLSGTATAFFTPANDEEENLPDGDLVMDSPMKIGNPLADSKENALDVRNYQVPLLSSEDPLAKNQKGAPYVKLNILIGAEEIAAWLETQSDQHSELFQQLSQLLAEHAAAQTA